MKSLTLCALPMLMLATFPACATESGGAPTAPSARSYKAGTETAGFTDWSAPVHLGPVVNSPGTEIEVSTSKDGLSLYIASNRSGNFDLWVSQRGSVDEPWGTPRNLGLPINTPGREQGPFLSIDGHRLFFFSDRPGGFGGLDLYVSRRRDQRDDFGWEPPVNLGTGVNGPANETLPVYFEDESGATSLYFTSNRTLPGDIYVSTLQADGEYAPASPVAEVNSARRERVLAIRRDGLELFIASDRPGPIAAPFDLWVSTRARTSDPWSAPVNLGLVVNGDSDDGSAALSFDALTLYISSDRTGGSGGHDLWVSTRARLR